MKNFFFLFLLSVGYTFAQESYPRVETITTKDLLMNGRIGDTPIQMYLSFYDFSSQSGHVYSVVGWYSKDENSAEKIQICGIYHAENLTLYRFDDKARESEILLFETEKGNYFEEVEYYENLEGYKEKFSLNDESKTRVSNGKSESLELYSENYRVYQRLEYLKFTEDHGFLLQNLGPWDWGFQLIAHHQGNFILGFEYGSNLNYNGRCGAGEESGLVELHFNEGGELMDYQTVNLESCLMDIEFEGREELNLDQMEYRCTHWNTDEKRVYIVNLEKATIVRK